MKLRAIAHARSGDKGTIVNISLIAFDERDYPRLVRQVTADRVKAQFADLFDGDVVRYELPIIGALNFVLHGVHRRRRHPHARARRARQVVELGVAGDGDSG